MLVIHSEASTLPYAPRDRRAPATLSPSPAKSPARRHRPAAHGETPAAVAAVATVYVIDRDAATRQQVENLVRTMHYASKSFAAIEEFQRDQEGPRPACVVMELTLPGINWLRLRQHSDAPDACLPVIFLTSLADVSLAVQAMRCGASHFFEKPFRGHDLWDAIQEAVELDARQQELDQWWQERRRRTSDLSSKEQSLLRLIGQGKSNQQIAEELQVCVRTVELNRASLLKKLETDSLRDAIELGMVLNWAEGQGPVEAILASERFSMTARGNTSSER